jgi:hypothetical protein
MKRLSLQVRRSVMQVVRLSSYRLSGYQVTYCVISIITVGKPLFILSASGPLVF